MSRVKILIVGPTKAGKSTIANILGDLQEGPGSVYRPTAGVRIIDFEREPPPSVASFGRINIEFWDISGDFKYENCWDPIKKGANGIIFVLDPAAPNVDDTMSQLVQLFPQSMKLPPKLCMAYVNHHNTGGGVLPQTRIPKAMESLDKHIGTAEDNQGIFQGFEKYLIKLLNSMTEQQQEDEA